LNILVDTSIWSLSLRRQSANDRAEVKRLQEIILSGEKIYTAGIILQEILQGIKDNNQFNKLKSHFEAFSLISPGADTYIYAATLFNKCRRSGIQLTTIDCLIASIAIQYDCYLFTADGDFSLIPQIAPLRLI
jgi:predicted nucleic acid-binding protein